MKRLVLVVGLTVLLGGVVVSSAAALRFDPGDCYESGPGGSWICPTGSVGAPYAAQLKGAGGCGPALPYTYRVLNGALPPGISLDSSGKFSGTPTTTGTYEFYLELSDQNPPSASWCRPETSERQFRITIIPGLSLETSSVPPATLNVPYSTTLQASPAGTLTWTITDGALPPGLTLGAATGVISGTPTTLGSYKFAIKVSDTEQRSSRREFRIDVAQPVAIGAQALARSEVGTSFQLALTATGGTGPGTYAWSLAGGALPPGLALAANGAITGTPTTPGSYGFTASVSDSAGRTATKPMVIAVAAKLAVATLTLPVGRAGRLYQAKLKSTGGVIPKLWKITQGPLPRGVRLDRKTGILSGVPRKAGKYRITVQITDGFKVTATRTLRLTILA